MSAKLSPELFREAISARVRIVNTLEKASDIQLYTAACILARIRVLQGQSVLAVLVSQDLERLGSAPTISRDAVLEFLLGA